MPLRSHFQHSAAETPPALVVPFAPVFVKVSDAQRSEAIVPMGAAVIVNEPLVAVTLIVYVDKLVMRDGNVAFPYWLLAE